MRHLSLLVIACMAAVLLIAGCESEREKLVPQPVTHTPLVLDPTEDYDIAQWWTNGDQMIRLDPQASYALYGDTNRYHKPIQTGRWDQLSYAVLRLSPYDQLHNEWIRVSVTKINDRIALNVLAYKPMFAIDGPPLAPEDHLVGPWTGDTGVLSLSDNRQYDYSLSPLEGINNPPIVAGHSGTWRLQDQRIILTPNTPNLGPFEIWVHPEHGVKKLVAPFGEFIPGHSAPAASPAPNASTS